MKKMNFLLFLMAAATCVFAQEQQKKKPVFQTQVQLGILEGQAGSQFQVQVINGMKWQGASAGVGIGLDYYGTRSIPLFLNLQKNILNHTKTPFIYANGGIHFPWISDKNTAEIIRTKPGLIYEAGVGYLVPAGKYAFSFTLGYSYKAYTERRESARWCLTGICENDVSNVSYQFRRISFNMGFRF
jgi:hypothetical protein